MLKKTNINEKRTIASKPNNQIVTQQQITSPKKLKNGQPQARAFEVIHQYSDKVLKTEEKKRNVQIAETPNGMFLQGYPYPIHSKNIIPLPWKDYKSLLKGYSELYNTLDFAKFAKTLGIRMGTISSKGEVQGIIPDIRKRLSAISLLSMAKENNYLTLMLPLIYDGDLEIIDDFRLFAYNDEIKSKFQSIDKIYELIINTTKLSLEKFKRFTDSPKVKFQNSKTGILNKIEPLDQNEALIIHNGKYDDHNIYDRLEMKHKVLKEFSSLKKTLLKELETELKLFQDFSPYIDKLFPNKVQAYMVFELILNQTLRIVNFCESNIDNTLFPKIFKERLYSIFNLVYLIELLLPYASEITKNSGIDLENNETLLYLRKFAKTGSERFHKEYELYEEKESEIVDSPVNIDEEIIETEKIEVGEVYNFETLILNPELEEQAKIKGENEVILLARKLATLEADKMRKMAREAKKTEKENTNLTNTTQKAKEIVSQHKEKEGEKEQRELKERSKFQRKIHDLPSMEFVQKHIIAQLKGDHLKHFEMLFEIVENDKVMTYENIKNLTKHIKEILVVNKIGCADDLKREVKMREHHRHDQDTGDLLPKYYVSILRTSFVIFGIFPKNWEPQTKKDFKAMIKYNSRLIDKILLEHKTI